MLPVTFRYNQGNLQDYVDCPRRFQLRYVQAQAWPAVQAEPVLEHERHLDRGAEFHRLVQRHQLGIDKDILTAGVRDPDLLVWWRSYLNFAYLHGLAGARYPEYVLSVGLSGIRLMAAFDLLVVIPGDQIIIFDWKTYNHVPERRWLEARLQTRVYPYVLASSGARLYGGRLEPERISMVYWVAGDPDNPVVFEYSVVQFQRDEAFLKEQLAEIARFVDTKTWPLTEDMTRCRFCGYRSLCGRGEGAGFLAGAGMEEINSALGDNFLLGLYDVGEDGF